MKIILASDVSFLLKYGYDLTGISKGQLRIGYVTTASKAARDQSFFEEVKRKIKENGYSFEEIDIEGTSKQELKDFFTDKNVIHVEGGNTFYLLKAIRQGEFGEFLKEWLDEDKVYIGTSAGAYIMCPTIEVATWNDNGKDKFGVTDFKALNFVPFVLKVHYKNDMEAMVKEKMKTLKYPLRILRDGQGIVVEDGEYTFVGDGEEVVLNAPEQFDVLDNQGNPTGKIKLRCDVHKDGDWHRAVHVWIMNSQGQFLIQKRSPQKDSDPNRWDISVAGHISAGETSIDTVVKEVWEEIGTHLKKSDFKYLFTTISQSVQKNGMFINNEFDDVYLAKLDLDISKIVLQKEEVVEVKWVDQKVLSDAYSRKDSSYVLHEEEYAKLLEYLNR